MKTKSADNYFKKKMKDRKFIEAYEKTGFLLDLGVTIARARNAIGLSQIEMAHKLKTTQSVISRIENGNQNISVQMLTKIAKVLGCGLKINLDTNQVAVGY